MTRKILKAAGISLVAIIIIVMALSPLAARKYINRNGRELTGRTLSLDKLRINYLTFTVRAIGFRMYEKDNSTLFTGFDTLLVDLQPLRLIGSELSVKRLWLVNPVSEIIKQDTLFNFSDILEFLSADDTTAVTEGSLQADTSLKEAGFRFEISDIRLKNGNFSFTDRDISHTTIVDNLNFTIPYISWNQEESSRAGLRFSFRNGGFFEAEGSFDPGSGSFSSRISIDNLDLGEFSAYLKPYINISSLSGLAGCDLDISGNSSRSEDILVAGTVSLNSFTMTDAGERKLLGIDTLLISIDEALPLKNSFHFGDISVSGPYALFEMKDSSNNFIELLPHSAPDSLSAEGADPGSVELQRSLKSFTVRNGSLDFNDLSLADPFSYRFSDIEFSTDTVSSTAQWLSFHSSMILNGKGDMQADVGSAILFGDMYYKGNTTITARQITSQNRLLIRNAEIGKKSGGITGVRDPVLHGRTGIIICLSAFYVLS